METRAVCAALRKMLGPCVLVLLVVCLAIGCKRDGAGASGRTPLRVGYNTGSLNRELFLQTGMDQGIFARQGLELADKGYSVGGQIAQDMAAGELDVGLLGISPSLAAIAQGGDLVVVASQTKNDAPLVARKGIDSLRDLDGKKVGTPGLSSIQETLLNHLERTNHLKTTHVYGKAADLVGYLEKGEIDAFVAWEPVAARAVQALGAHYLLDTVTPNAEASEIAVSGKLLREHRDVVVRFLRAMEETRRYVAEHTDERVKVAAIKSGLPEAVVSEGVRRSHLFLDGLPLNLESVRFFAAEDVASAKLKGVTLEGLDAFLAKAIDTMALKEALGGT
jgi:NitT/TauT family transport system substrate-binding protein